MFQLLLINLFETLEYIHVRIHLTVLSQEDLINESVFILCMVVFSAVSIDQYSYNSYNFIHLGFS